MKNGKGLQKGLFLVISLLLVASYFALDANNRDRFNKAEQGYTREGAWVVNLDKGLSETELAEFLAMHNYVDEADAPFVASFLTGRFRKDTLPQSVFALDGNSFRLPAQLVQQQGTQTYRKRLEQMRSERGWNSTVDSLYRSASVPSTLCVGDGTGEPMKVTVYRPKTEEELSWSDQLLGRKRLPLPGVMVRLDQHLLDEMGVPYQTNLGYAMTDRQGVAVFTGLDPEGSYSVLPVQMYRSFGQAKGTYRGSWALQTMNGETEYSFLSADEYVRLFTTAQLRRMRDDGRMTVRTPSDYRSAVTGFLITYILVWLAIFCIGNTGNRRMDNGMAAALMAVMGMGVMFMFGIHDPLGEKMTGKEMGDWVCLGSAGIGALLCFDIRRFFRGGYLIPFDPVGVCLRRTIRAGVAVLHFFGLGRLWRWSGRLVRRLTLRFIGRKRTASLWTAGRRFSVWCSSFWNMRAMGYFALAALLTGWLFVAGQAIGGMKVNLNLFGLVFQPSEIVKYLLVVVMAAWFFEKGDLIMSCSMADRDRTGVWNLFLRKYKALMTLGLCLSILAVMYMMLSDLGPLLVLGLTFIILMSLVKSRVPLYGGTQTDCRAILDSDFGMLMVGAGTFLAALLAGHVSDLCIGTHLMVAGHAVEYKAVMSMVWLVAWVSYGVKKGQIWDSAILFNLLVFLFIYGGDILALMGFEEEALRFQGRSDMAMNPFGSYVDGKWVPTVNLQVAQALWAISTGGITGTGIGDTMAHFIPAGTTDLVLASLAETWGLVGVLLYMYLLMVILHRGLLAGYRSSHPFVLYLCAGIVIAGFIQFAVVSLGCVGLLPLTGVNTVFLSSGKVSLLMNALAFGTVLSVSARNAGQTDTRITSHMMLPYRYAIAFLCIVFLMLTGVIVARMVQYQVFQRDETMVKGAVAYDRSGAVSLVYNPRIDRVLDKMQAGSVFDRNGIPVATGNADMLTDSHYADIYRQIGISDWQKLSSKVMDRYYPVQGMEWMTGNLNTGYGASSLDKWPKGLMADVRWLSEMRGYDNIQRDEDGQQMTIALHSDRYKVNRFLPEASYEQPTVQLRDYSPLLPFLKEGLAGTLIGRYNSGQDTGLQSTVYKDGKRVEVPLRPKDIHLTVDAHLQAVLQQKMMRYRYSPYSAKVRKGLEFWKDYERRSIVIMDAERGEVLASVNPPVDMQRLLDGQDDSYNDRGRDKDFTAYTDADLGLVFPTEPGSTAKVMTALAMVNHMDSVGREIGKKKYFVHKDEQIHASLATANRSFGLQEAVMYSSNVWFIHAANDLNLYPGMANIFGHTGVQIDGRSPYSLAYQQPSADYLEQVNKYAPEALAKYERYMERRGTFVDGTKYYRKLKDNTAGKGWYFSWGQQMAATPLAMCRVIATVASDGNMPVSTFRLDEEPQQVQLVQPGRNLEALQKAMRSEVTKNAYYPNLLHYGVSGKTGTPERRMSGEMMKRWNYIAEKMDKRHPRSYDWIPDHGNLNDAWYTCYIPDCTISTTVDGQRTVRTASLAVAVRIERTVAQSDYAKHMADKVVLPVLAQLGYLK